jgi:hypothetical protein
MKKWINFICLLITQSNLVASSEQDMLAAEKAKAQQIRLELIYAARKLEPQNVIKILMANQNISSDVLLEALNQAWYTNKFADQSKHVAFAAIVKSLIERDPKILNQSRLLEDAIKWQRKDAETLFLALGAQPEPDLVKSARKLDLQTVNKILTSNQNISSDDLFEALSAAWDQVKETYSGEPPKQLEANPNRPNFFPIATALIKRDPHIINMNLFLVTAAWNGDQEALKFFLDHGAFIDQQDAGGKTALHAAATAYIYRISESASENIVKLLLNAGANPYIKDKNGHVFTDFAKPGVRKIWHEFQKEQQDKINKMRETLGEHRQQLPAEDTATPQHLTPDLLKIIDQYYRHHEPEINRI